MINDRRIRVIVGHYGSGKTEFAVNYVVNLSKLNKKVALADLDIVNPYFRSREKESILQEYGIKVISSNVKGLNSDLPAVTGEVLGPLQDKSYDVVLDVGGDSVGARSLVRYTEYFTSEDYDMFLVINGNRGETTSVEGVLKHIDSIEAVCQVRVTGIINNTHLLRHTTVEDVLRGQELCLKVSRKRNIPIKYVCAIEPIINRLPKDIEGSLFPIKMFMREDWM
ncbi:ATP-binding protein [Serpentinicella alkaliphila]|uniref:ATP-binding protein n=1 Tax=Serpentinicella alkaliphila TaxID=1734049 RepID=A0A4R2TGQ6_9FIRM|nr:ATP-binding protein [Serpentinicella alkaliphila]QUH25534.1 ATP-binding protein [Serpentinicella alkaliphila]TCQ01886.1 hypothetical protein EDD79_102116 [Serpentinicella alkaliphila]